LSLVGTAHPTFMPNIKLTIAYDGSNYCGWQRQRQQLSIQGVLENKISLICQEKIILHSAGRTDAGVHAWGQAANFSTQRQMTPVVWRKALNSLLPTDIVIREVEEVETDFHARYWAREKHYRYRLLLSPIRWPFERNYAWHIPYPLNLEDMREASTCLLGQHDFSSFQAAGSRVKSSVRHLRDVIFKPSGDILEINFIGDGFLRHMVRNMVGTLVEVGRGKSAAADLAGILAARDRSRSGPTAPPQGLYLVAVKY